jgi:hypothetical protein
MESATLLDRARDFIWRNARLLERQRFAHAFDGGPAAPIVATLRAYQNADGGFGNALEPDMRCTDSQPVATEQALHVLVEIGGDAALAARAADWLASVTTDEGGVPYVLPTVRTAPHAPWWTPASDAPPASPNPTAVLVGLLTALGVQHPWLAPATAYCWRVIEESAPEEVHELLSILAFLEHTPERARAERAFAVIAARLEAKGLVELDPAAEGYIKKPLEWAPTPTSPCRRLFADDVIAAHLDALAARQQPDGGWPITWPPVSPASEMEWRGVVTLAALHTLRAHGRLT